MRRMMGSLVMGLVLLLGGILAGCGTEAKEAQTIGPPTKTVEQVKEWPKGLEPAGGGIRLVDMPTQAKGNLVEASKEAEPAQSYFQAIQRR